MTELKMVYELVISRANPLDNPRYELLNHAQRMRSRLIEGHESSEEEQQS